MTAALSLAIGIGANTAISTAANGLLLAPTRGVSNMHDLMDIGRITERIYAEQVSASCFDVLGVQPSAGTFFRTPIVLNGDQRIP